MMRSVADRPEAARPTGYEVVRLALGLLLLTAAALKGHQLATEPVVATGLLDSRWLPIGPRWLLIGIVEFELFFGLWLWSGLYPRRTWHAALVCFTGLGCVSLYKALTGEATCGCFGRVPVNPWYTVMLDLIIVVSLLYWRPKEPPSTGSRQAIIRTAGVLVIGALVGLPAARMMVSYSHVVRGMTYEMGTICLDDTKVLKHAFVVRNDTTETIHFAKPESSCGCTRTRLDEEVISPGESAILTMEVNLEGRTGPRTFSTNLIDSKERKWSFQIHANTYKALSFTPDGVHIGPLRPRATVKKKITATSCIPNGRNTFPTLVIGPTQEAITVDRTNEISITREDEIAKKTELLDVRVTAGDNPGLYSCAITAKCRESGRIVRIPVTWTVESLYRVSPPRVFVESFASSRSPVEIHLSIESLDRTPFEVDRIVCNDPAVTCELLDTEASSSKQSIKVVVSPIGRGYLYCQLEVDTDLPGQNRIVIPVVAVNSDHQKSHVSAFP